VIRQATEADVPRLVTMGQRFARETGYARLIEVDPARLGGLIRDTVASPAGVVFVSENGSGITGLIALAIAPHPYSGEPTAFEMAWWVEPEARGAGVRLLAAAEAWARDNGAASVQMVAPAGSEIGRLYGRRGYAEVESSWSRRL